MSTLHFIECPAEGCERTGTLESVRNHYNAKEDAAHSTEWGPALL